MRREKEEGGERKEVNRKRQEEVEAPKKTRAGKVEEENNQTDKGGKEHRH